MIATIDGVVVHGTPEEIARLLELRAPRSDFLGSPTIPIIPTPQPCGCGTTGGCQANPKHGTWYLVTGAQGATSPVTISRGDA